MNGKDLKPEKASLRDYLKCHIDGNYGFDKIKQEMLRDEYKNHSLRLVCVNGKRIT